MKQPIKLLLFIGAAIALIFVASPVLAQDKNLSRNLAATCASCHGTNGVAKDENIAPLAGMDKQKMIKLFKYFRSKDLPSEIMHQISKGYTDEQLELIAEFYSKQK